MDIKTKLALKTQYIDKLSNIYADILESKTDIVADLIEKASTECVTISECDEHLMEEGAVTEMCQGKYSIMRENPYNGVKDKASKRYLALINKLDSMQPDAKTASINKAGENLARLVVGGKPVELR